MDTLVTAVLAKVEQTPAEAETGMRTLRWSNAGHPPPVLLHPDGRAELLERPADRLLGATVGSPRHDHTGQPRSRLDSAALHRRTGRAPGRPAR
ncbi:SpoIIE family protein phosphatase, partial [Modestobacter marinus]|uniref:SpoIIE family protein phosphatase n=1 Tax=Modestobacter marinus TaxID=477641 RepID=UPI00141AD1CA